MLCLWNLKLVSSISGSMNEKSFLMDLSHIWDKAPQLNDRALVLSYFWVPCRRAVTVIYDLTTIPWQLRSSVVGQRALNQTDSFESTKVKDLNERTFLSSFGRMLRRRSWLGAFESPLSAQQWNSSKGLNNIVCCMAHVKKIYCSWCRKKYGEIWELVNVCKQVVSFLCVGRDNRFYHGTRNWWSRVI